MHDKLKTFIKENKDALDTNEPSINLWTKIETKMNITQTLPVKSKWLSWLKYIGLSAPVMIAIVYFSYKEKENKIDNMHLSTETKQVKTIFIESSISDNKKNDSNKKQSESNSISELNPKPTLLEHNERLIPQHQAKISPTSETAHSNANEQAQVPHSNPQINSTTNLLAQGTKPLKRLKKAKSENTILVDSIFRGIKKVEIDASFFDIKLVSSQTDNVLFHGEMNTELHGLFLSKIDCKIKCEQKDSVLHVFIETKGNTSVGFGSINQKAFLNFDVPAMIDVVINSNSGDINIDGIKGKTCDIHSEDGNIKITNANTNLTLQSGSGNSFLNTVKGNLNIKSSDGDQQLENINGAIDLKNQSGNITIKQSIGSINVLSTDGNIKLNTIDGNVIIKSNSGDTDIKTLSGDMDIISIDGNVSITDSKGNILIANQSGNITGKNVEIKNKSDLSSTDGNIIMNFKNEFNDLSFDLKSDDGNLKVNKNGQKLEGENGQLFLDKGKIVIKGYTTSGDQSYE